MAESFEFTELDESIAIGIAILYWKLYWYWYWQYFLEVLLTTLTLWEPFNCQWCRHHRSLVFNQLCLILCVSAWLCDEYFNAPICHSNPVPFLLTWSVIMHSLFFYMTLHYLFYLASVVGLQIVDKTCHSSYVMCTELKTVIIGVLLLLIATWEKSVRNHRQILVIQWT